VTSIVPVACSILAASAVALAQPGLNESVEREVEQNIRSQPIGSHTVNDLGLSDGLVRRFRDRVVRSSFEDRYRMVVADASGTPAPSTQPDAASSPAAAAPRPSAPAPAPPAPPSPLPWVLGAGGVILVVTLAVLLRKGRPS